MKLKEYTFSSDMGNNYLSIVKDNKCGQDTIAEKVIRSDKPYFLADVNEVNINGEELYKYDLGSYITLDKLNMKLKKTEALTLMKNLLVPLTICKDWLLDSHSIIFDRQFIMVNDRDMNIKYIYNFDKNSRSSDEEIAELFTDIVRNIDVINDPLLLNEFMRYVLKGSFSVSGLLEIVEKYDTHITQESNNRSNVVNTANMSTINPKPLQSVEQKAKAVPHIIEKKSDPAPVPINPFETGDVLINPFGETEKKNKEGTKSLFNILKKKDDKESKTEKASKKLIKEKKKKKENMFSANGLFDVTDINKIENYSDETQIDFETEVPQEDEMCLELVSSLGSLNAPQIIDIVLKNGEMTIGRKADNSNNDYEFPAEFKKISRTHAKIIKADQCYFICDINARNNTYVNGNVICKDTRVMLNEDDLIMFGDRDYSYKFKRR